MALRVLVTDRLTLEAQALLRSSKLKLDLQFCQAPTPTAQELSGAHALLIRSRTIINKNLLDQAPQLRVIISATSGYDHIDLPAADERKLVVMHTPWGNAQSAAELSWLLALACSRKLKAASQMIQQGQWRRELVTGTELYQKTLGIIGLGRVGGKVAHIALAFGLKVIAYDPWLEESDFAWHKVERASLEELLKTAHIVSLHVPQNQETHHLLDDYRLSLLNEQTILINTSRGAVVDEQALATALERKKIGAVGLDVFAQEPLPSRSPLLAFENAILTPHVGASTHEALARVSLESAQKLLDFLATGAITDSLLPQRS